MRIVDGAMCFTVVMFRATVKVVETIAPPVWGATKTVISGVAQSIKAGWKEGVAANEEWWQFKEKKDKDASSL